MEDHMIFHKSLHLLIDHFIKAIDSYDELSDVEKNKIYLEIIKRSSTISRKIRTTAISALTTYKTAVSPVLEDIIHNKTKHFVESFLQQDLLECALTTEDYTCDVSILNDDLHNILFKCSLNDVGSITSPFRNHLSNVSFGSKELSCNLLHSPSSMYAADVLNNNCFTTLSNEFQDSVEKFQNELSSLKCALENGILTTGLKTNDIDCYSSEKITEDISGSCGFGSTFESQAVNSNFEDFLFSTIFPDVTKQHNFPDAFVHEDVFTNNLSWEHCMRQSISCHLYSSELAGKEILLNVTTEDPHVFQLIHEETGSISENDFILDILDLLIGIPSRIFFYDENKGKFQVKPFTRLSKLSHESTLRFAEKFLECGTMFYKLKAFCTEKAFPQRGLVLNGLKNGIREILSVYVEYIAAVRTNSPTIQILKRDVAENAQLLITLGEICCIHYGENVFVEFPKGLNMLSSVSTSAWSCRQDGNIIMIAVLLKNIYLPYFNYLNKWMADGICYDPYNEFQIIEDIKYLNRRDELYWRFTYTENEDDISRVIPIEIKKYSHDILQCGKSMRFLQDCCPQIFNLEYLACNPPPTLSMVFSYRAMILKKAECDAFIAELEEAELKHKESKRDISENEYCVEKQLLVDRKLMLKYIEKRWNRLSGCRQARNTILFNPEQLKNESLKRSSSFPALQTDFETDVFSGIHSDNIGLLFSSCGYNDRTNCPISVNGSPPVISYNSSSPCVRSFNQQLNLKSYFHYIPNNSDEIQLKHCKKLASSNEEIGIAKKLNNLREKEFSLAEYGTNQSPFPLGSFVDRLASLLVSEYGDTKQEIYSFIQLTSLQKILEYNFSPILNIRKHITEKTVMDYVANQLKLQDLLMYLKNTYFLQDEAFSQSLCEKLFMRVLKCSTLNEFADWIILNEILSSSISVPSLSNIPFLETASVNFMTLPEQNLRKRNLFLQYFYFEFTVDWPLNIIIHKACITQYANIFSLLIEMEFLCWLLGKIWRSLLTDAKMNCTGKYCLENSPQYRALMLYRFDMHHFIRVLHNCIHQDLGGPLWECLMKSLNEEELSIDALEQIHCQYLEKALTRCFLTEETSFFREIVNESIWQVYEFCESALACSWKLNPHSMCYEFSEFGRLNGFYLSFKNCKDKFYDCLFKIIGKRKFSKSWDEEFPRFLENVLETGKNIS